jgi:hypothetical protein
MPCSTVSGEPETTLAQYGSRRAQYLAFLDSRLPPVRNDWRQKTTQQPWSRLPWLRNRVTGGSLSQRYLYCGNDGGQVRSVGFRKHIRLPFAMSEYLKICSGRSSGWQRSKGNAIENHHLMVSCLQCSINGEILPQKPVRSQLRSPKKLVWQFTSFRTTRRPAPKRSRVPYAQYRTEGKRVTFLLDLLRAHWLVNYS